MFVAREYDLIMSLGPSTKDTRIILRFGGRDLPMSIGDTSIVAEFANDHLDDPHEGINGVLLDDGMTLEFHQHQSGLRVECHDHKDASGNPLATMILLRPDVSRFCRDVRQAGEEAGRHLNG